MQRAFYVRLMLRRLLRLLNRAFRLLPPRYGGLFVERSGRYHLIPPEFLRAASVPQSFYLGQQVLDWLTIHVPLRQDARVLDVGCGDGRVAAAFARAEGFTGTYAGVDINRERIGALTRAFAGQPRFRFQHVDLFHSYYNTGGRLDPAAHAYPYPPETFDLIFFNSIFSHLRLSVIANHLRNAKRCLAPGGKVWLTCYLIDEQRERDEVGENRRFDQGFDLGYTATPAEPEGIVAYEQARLLSTINEAGLAVEQHIRGHWHGRRHSLDQHEQDVIVCAPP